MRSPIFMAAQLTLLLLVVAMPAQADHDSGEIEAIIGQLEDNRRQVVDENMALDASAADDFWQVYDRYRGEMRELQLQGFTLLREFKAHFDELTDERATQVMSTYFDLQTQELAIRERYIESFNDALSPKDTLRLYQIENKIDAIIQSDVSAVTPLVP